MIWTILKPSFLLVALEALTYRIGGVGYDINCGVRLIRTNLDEKDVEPVKEELAQAMYDHIPVGVGSKGIIPITYQRLVDAMVRSTPPPHL